MHTHNITCGRLKKAPLLKYNHTLIPRNYECYPMWPKKKKDLAVMFNLRILRWGNYPVSHMNLKCILSFMMREIKGINTQRGRWVMKETESTVMWQQGKEFWRAPEAVKGKISALELLDRTWPCWHHDFDLVKMILDFHSSELRENKCLSFYTISLWKLT